MRLLLTSGGVTNPSIQSALAQLLGRPVAECHALVVPTAQWGHPRCGPASVRGLVAAKPDFRHFSGLGWASLGVLELSRCQRSAWTDGSRGSGRPTFFWSMAATRPTCVTGCGVRAGRPAAFAPRDGLGGSQCRKHGDDASHRGVLRRVAVSAGRPHSGDRRLLHLPAPGRLPEQQHGGRRTVGRRHWCPGVRHRRTDGHHRRGRIRPGDLRRPLEGVPAVAIPRAR